MGQLYEIIAIALMGIWVLLWLLEGALKIRDYYRSRGCHCDEDDGFCLSFIKLGNHKKKEE